MKFNTNNIIEALTVIQTQILNLNNHIETNKVQADNLRNNQNQLKRLKIEVIEKLGVEYEPVESDMLVKEAKEILNQYINPIKNKGKNSENKKPNYKIKETKLVELSRLRVYRKIHMNCCLNPNKNEAKRAKILDYMNENDGSYPKSEAILVWKDKDPEDRRRIIYKIEDGYRRFILSEELGLDKVCVDIIEE